MRTKLIQLAFILFLTQYGYTQKKAEIPFEIGANGEKYLLKTDKSNSGYKFVLEQENNATSKKEFSMQMLSEDNFIFLFTGNLIKINSKISPAIANDKAKELYSIITNNNKDQPTLVAEYDYQKHVYSSDELKPKHKQPVVFKIININKLAHDILITENDVKIKDEYLDADTEAAATIISQTKPTEEITSETSTMQIEAPKKLVDDSKEKTKLKNSDIEKLQNSINADKIKLQNKKNETERKITELFTIETDVAALENNKRLLQSNDKSYDKKIADFDANIATKNDLKPALNININELKKDVTELSLEIEKQEIELMRNNNNLINFKLLLSKINEKFNDIQMSLVNINRINAAYSNYINFIIIPTLTKDQYARYAEKICIVLKLDKRNEYYGYINEFEREYAQFNQQYNALFNSDVYYDVIHLDDNSAYSKLVKLNLENLKKEVERIHKVVNITELRTKLHNVELFDNVLSSDNAFTVYSDPIQPFEDYLEFKVKISQNKNLGTSVLKEQDKVFTYTEYVRQSVRWDFSVGTVFDFGIKNQEYEIKKNESTSKYQIIENNSSEYTPTIAGLLHTSFRSNNMFAFGLSLGASIDLTNLNLNSFFPGVSLLIGKREKVIFTVGPAFKRVNQLKAIYQTNTDYTEQLQTENVTSMQFKTGWFAGISWNLTNKQKSKMIPQK
ncbi:MAG: hypothetical protein IM568_14055 [Flavobacterium sp.]|nr:hypothetical protein [Flavobacterium sp.]